MRIRSFVIYLLTLVVSLQRCYGLSTFTQITRTNLQEFAFIKITVRSEGVDQKSFVVQFTLASEIASSSDHISGFLEIRSGEELIASSSVSGARASSPTAYDKQKGIKQRPVVFSFVVTVSRSIWPPPSSQSATTSQTFRDSTITGSI